jgi:anti-sigma regulatory factor (Ser/Thr protein kinase)
MVTTRLRIGAEHDVSSAVLEARGQATRVGFDVVAATQFSTAVSELARNILKYATRGEVLLTRLAESGRIGVEAVVSDKGPGIADLETALQDHFSSGGTLGLGLPGVRRMMDEFDIRSTPDQGTVVTIRSWLGTPGAGGAGSTSADVGACSGPLEGVTDNLEWSCYVRMCFGHRVGGDAAVVVTGDGWVLAGLIDVLGHGPESAPLASKLAALIRSHGSLEPISLLEFLHESIKGDRGAAVGLCRVETASGEASFVGVGNTALRVLGSRSVRLHSVEGVLGDRMRRLRVQRLVLGQEDLLLMYTDGVSSRFKVADLPELLFVPATRAARELVAHFGKRHDDASCIALRYER